MEETSRLISVTCWWLSQLFEISASLEGKSEKLGRNYGARDWHNAKHPTPGEFGCQLQGKCSSPKVLFHFHHQVEDNPPKLVSSVQSLSNIQLFATPWTGWIWKHYAKGRKPDTKVTYYLILLHKIFRRHKSIDTWHRLVVARDWGPGEGRWETGCGILLGSGGNSLKLVRISACMALWIIGGHWIIRGEAMRVPRRS